MTVCRYFLQGNCRFGERCRFEHTQYGSGRHNNSDRGNQQDRYRYQNQQNYSQTNEYSYGNRRYDSPDRYSANQHYESPDRYGINQRYESPNRYGVNQHNESYNYRYGVNQRYESPDRYSGNQRYSSPYRYTENYNSQGRYDAPSGYYNQQHTNRSNQKVQRSDYGQTPQKPSNNERYSSSGHYSGNVYGQNRYQWQSEDYAKQRQHQTKPPHQTNTSKSKDSVSFRVPDSELKSATSYHSTEDQDFAEVVKEDATAWELGEQWPFTCYFPYPDKPAFPGFSDVSPEELRYEAYKAKENNAYQSYVETVNNALHDITNKRNRLKVLSPELMNIIGQIRRGDSSPFSSVTGTSSVLQFGQSIPESMNTASSAFGTEGSAAAFSFKVPLLSTPISKTSASTFSFKLPLESESKPSGFGVPLPQDKSSEDYTALENLTEDEKEQFSASTFTLGKIPTKPPPHVLCF